MEMDENITEALKLLRAMEPEALDQLMVMIREWGRLYPRQEVQRLRLVGRGER